MNYKEKIYTIVNRIIADCKAYNVDLKLVIEEVNKISNTEEERLNCNDEFYMQGFVDEDEIPVMANLDDSTKTIDNNLSNNNLNINSEVPVMTDLDDIAKSIFSDIYGGIY